MSAANEVMINVWRAHLTMTRIRPDDKRLISRQNTKNVSLRLRRLTGMFRSLRLLSALMALLAGAGKCWVERHISHSICILSGLPFKHKSFSCGENICCPVSFIKKQSDGISVKVCSECARGQRLSLTDSNLPVMAKGIRSHH